MKLYVPKQADKRADSFSPKQKKIIRQPQRRQLTYKGSTQKIPLESSVHKSIKKNAYIILYNSLYFIKCMNR